MLFGFSSASDAEKLFSSKRFTALGAVGKNGKKYELKRKEIPFDKRKDLPAAERAFVEMSAGASGRDVLVWFGKPGLLVLGDDAFATEIAGVVEDGRESLQDSKQYKDAAGNFESGGSMFVFFDAGVLRSLDDASAKKLMDQYLKGGEPVVASAKFVGAGMLVNLRGTLSGDALPQESTFTPAVTLKMPQKLPAETLGYVALSTKSKMTGKQAEDLLKSNVVKADPRLGGALQEGLSKMDEVLGFNVSTIYDALGDQGVVAVLVGKGYRFDPGKGGKDALGSLAVTCLQHVKDKPSAEKIVTNLKQKLFDAALKGSFKVTPDGAGFSAEPVQGGMGLPSVQVRFLDDVLLVSAGASALVERSLSAYKDGKDALGGDGAHASAISALSGDPHVVLWVDTGRILDQLLKSNPQIGAEVTKLGFPIDALQTSGKERVTSAMAVSVKPESGAWRARWTAWRRTPTADSPR
jgi:hypothetical protein